MSTNNRGDPFQSSTSPHASTNGSRGHKRPRSTKIHLATCQNSSNSAIAINCECLTHTPEQRDANGYYISEPDDIDVPLSKRINRLNIENPASSNIAGRDSPAFSSNSSSETNAVQSPYQHERLNNTINIDNVGIHTTQSVNYLNSTSLQNGSHESMHQNHVIGNANVINHMQSHNVPQHNGASSSNHYLENINLATDSSFKERYNYPESSLYYEPNQLLNSLYQERQLRQNNTSQ